MIYVKFELDTDLCGTYEDDYRAFPDGTTEEDINEALREMVIDHCEIYDYMVYDEIDEDEFDTEEEYDEAREQAFDDFYTSGLDNSSWSYITETEWVENNGSLA